MIRLASATDRGAVLRAVREGEIAGVAGHGERYGLTRLTPTAITACSGSHWGPKRNEIRR
ncbi:hypothetical protein [Streptomyces sp. Qhu_M48]|uniref:hypothetical protein n=1 Tax=Streptomyces sp. Qhu_M48 TaxID=3435889 RepID=UPI003F5097E8